MNKNIRIAIDGLAGAGKGTLGKDLAKKLGTDFIDSGSYYRAITYILISNNKNLKDIKISNFLKSLDLKKIDSVFDFNKNKTIVTVNGKDISDIIRGQEISKKVIEVSKLKEIREYINNILKKRAKDISVVIDGRDIGTEVLKDAEFKFFIYADSKIRAKRRYDELKSKGENITLEEIENTLVSRDNNDMNRIESPLKLMEYQIKVDNSNMNREQQLNYCLEIINKKK